MSVIETHLNVRNYTNIDIDILLPLIEYFVILKTGKSMTDLCWSCLGAGKPFNIESGCYQIISDPLQHEVPNLFQQGNFIV